MGAHTLPSVSPLELDFSRQRSAFAGDPYPTAFERRERLQRLIQALLARQDEIADALDRDFGGRCRAEVRYAEIFVSLQSLRHARRHLKRWMKPRPCPYRWRGLG